MPLQTDTGIEERWGVWSCISTYRNTACFRHPRCALSLQSGPSLTLECLLWWMLYLLLICKEKLGKTCGFICLFWVVRSKWGLWRLPTHNQIKTEMAFYTDADLWAPAGCTASCLLASAEAGRSVCNQSPPDPAPTGWMRSVQTAPAAEKNQHCNATRGWQWAPLFAPCSGKTLPLAWSQAHQKAWVTLCRTCRTA